MIRGDSPTSSDSPRSYEDPEKGSPKRKRGQGSTRTRKSFHSQAISPSGVYPISTGAANTYASKQQFQEGATFAGLSHSNSTGNYQCDPSDGMSSFEGAMNATANNMTDNSGYTDQNSQSQSQSTSMHLKNNGVSFDFVPSNSTLADLNSKDNKGGKVKRERNPREAIGKSKGVKKNSNSNPNSNTNSPVSNSNALELGLGSARKGRGSNPSQNINISHSLRDSTAGMDTSTEEQSTDATDEQSSIFDSISRNVSGVYSPPLSPSNSFYAHNGAHNNNNTRSSSDADLADLGDLNDSNNDCLNISHGSLNSSQNTSIGVIIQPLSISDRVLVPPQGAIRPLPSQQTAGAVGSEGGIQGNRLQGLQELGGSMLMRSIREVNENEVNTGTEITDIREITALSSISPVGSNHSSCNTSPCGGSFLRGPDITASNIHEESSHSGLNHMNHMSSIHSRLGVGATNTLENERERENMLENAIAIDTVNAGGDLNTYNHLNLSVSGGEVDEFSSRINGSPTKISSRKAPPGSRSISRAVNSALFSGQSDYHNDNNSEDDYENEDNRFRSSFEQVGEVYLGQNQDHDPLSRLVAADTDGSPSRSLSPTRFDRFSNQELVQETQKRKAPHSTMSMSTVSSLGSVSTSQSRAYASASPFNNNNASSGSGHSHNYTQNTQSQQQKSSEDYNSGMGERDSTTAGRTLRSHSRDFLSEWSSRKQRNEGSQNHSNHNNHNSHASTGARNIGMTQSGTAGGGMVRVRELGMMGPRFLDEDEGEGEREIRSERGDRNEDDGDEGLDAEVEEAHHAAQLKMKPGTLAGDMVNENENETHTGTGDRNRNRLRFTPQNVEVDLAEEDSGVAGSLSGLNMGLNMAHVVNLGKQSQNQSQNHHHQQSLPQSGTRAPALESVLRSGSSISPYGREMFSRLSPVLPHGSSSFRDALGAASPQITGFSDGSVGRDKGPSPLNQNQGDWEMGFNGPHNQAAGGSGSEVRAMTPSSGTVGLGLIGANWGTPLGQMRSPSDIDLDISNNSAGGSVSMSGSFLRAGVGSRTSSFGDSIAAISALGGGNTTTSINPSIPSINEFGQTQTQALNYPSNTRQQNQRRASNPTTSSASAFRRLAAGSGNSGNSGGASQPTANMSTNTQMGQSQSGFAPFQSGNANENNSWASTSAPVQRRQSWTGTVGGDSSSSNGNHPVLGLGQGLGPPLGSNGSLGQAHFHSPSPSGQHSAQNSSAPVNSVSGPGMGSNPSLRPLPDQSAFDSMNPLSLGMGIGKFDNASSSPVCPATPMRTPTWSLDTIEKMSPLEGADSLSHANTHSNAMNSLGLSQQPPLLRQNSLNHNKVLLTTKGLAASGFNNPQGQMNFHKDFVEEGLLGSGTFADVYRVRQRLRQPAGDVMNADVDASDESASAGNDTLPSLQQQQQQGEQVALGRLYAVKKSKRQFRSKKDREWLLREVKSMQTISDHPFSYNGHAADGSPCPYVLQLAQAWQENGYFFVQIELAERGTLKDLLTELSTSNLTVPDKTVWHILHDVCAGLHHMHAAGMVHLDIKPANLLISDVGMVKIGDFGMAAEQGIGEDGREGDTRYLAPELLQSSDRQPSADIFSLGLTLYEICVPPPQHGHAPSAGGAHQDPSLHTLANMAAMKHAAAHSQLPESSCLPSEGQLWHDLREGRAAILPDRPPSLVAAIGAAMAPAPLDRATALQLLRLPEAQATLDSQDDTLLQARPRIISAPHIPHISSVPPPLQAGRAMRPGNIGTMSAAELSSFAQRSGSGSGLAHQQSSQSSTSAIAITVDGAAVEGGSQGVQRTSGSTLSAVGKQQGLYREGQAGSAFDLSEAGLDRDMGVNQGGTDKWGIADREPSVSGTQTGFRQNLGLTLTLPAVAAANNNNNNANSTNNSTTSPRPGSAGLHPASAHLQPLQTLSNDQNSHLHLNSSQNLYSRVSTPTQVAGDLSGQQFWNWDIKPYSCNGSMLNHNHGSGASTPGFNGDPSLASPRGGLSVVMGGANAFAAGGGFGRQNSNTTNSASASVSVNSRSNSDTFQSVTDEQKEEGER